MAGKKRITRRAALGIVAGGGALVTTETLGFTNVTGDRGVDVRSDQSEDALLSVVAEDSIGELTGNDGEVSVAELTNRFNRTLDWVQVTVEEIEDHDNTDVLTADADPSTDLEQDQTSDATVACAEEENLGERTVTFGLSATDSSTGSSVSVDGVTFDVDIDIQCQQGSIEPTDSGLDSVFASDLENGDSDQEQTFEFTLTEDMLATEEVTITLPGAVGGNRLQYQNADFSVDIDAMGLGGTAEGNRDGSTFVITFSPNVALTAGTRVTITADGVDASRRNANGTWDAIFQRSGYDADEETTFEVS